MSSFRVVKNDKEIFDVLFINMEHSARGSAQQQTRQRTMSHVKPSVYSTGSVHSSRVQSGAIQENGSAIAEESPATLKQSRSAPLHSN